MKIRSGFVSNSSSSSFIVMPSDIFLVQHMSKDLKDPTTLIVPFIFGGEVEFGRQRENYKDFGSRLNFAYLQALHLKGCRETKAENYYNGFLKDNLERTKIYNRYQDGLIDSNYDFEINMLEKVLKDNIPGLLNIKWNLLFEDFPMDEPPENVIIGYIDHQSLWYDNPDNYWQIFESTDSVFNWLFGVDNYVANRSDEYADGNDLEVDHRLDYEYDWHDDKGFYSSLYNEENYKNE